MHAIQAGTPMVIPQADAGDRHSPYEGPDAPNDPEGDEPENRPRGTAYATTGWSWL